MIEIMLRELGFSMEDAINYDPHHVISDKKEANKSKPFDHYEVAGLLEVENWMDYRKDINNCEDM